MKLIVGVNDLATTKPDLAAQAHGWDPTTVTAGSNRELEWIHITDRAVEHVWSATVNKRSQGGECAVCHGLRIIVGVNDLATVRPELAAQAHGWDPTTVTAHSGKKLEWMHTTKEGVEHVWSATVADRSNGHGCAVCNGRQVLAGETDLATTNPELAKQAHGWDPTTVTAGSNKKLEWICTKEDIPHVWSAIVASRSNGGECAVCHGLQINVGINDLATINPELAKQAHGWDPTTVTAGSNKKLEWICAKEDIPHVWSATVADRSSGEGCPTCAINGFDRSKPGWLYFMEHVRLDLLQIGISNVIKDRLVEHRGNGWMEIKVLGPWGLGEHTYQWEQHMLKGLESLGVVFAKDAGYKTYNGVTITEAWTRDSFDAKLLEEIMALVPAKVRGKLVEPPAADTAA